MIAAIKPAGANTRGLLAYLYGRGTHDEHFDPHIVAGFAMLGMPDPGRDENATLTELARYLDEPVRLRNSEFGKPVTDHVWHCPVRTAPEDRYLSDAEWGEIAQRIVQAAGIAPAGDDLACRWIAVRHADDHIHILATTVREDGRRPKLHDSGIRVGDACREIEKDYGLRRLKKGDRTGARRPTQAEMHKAERLGWDQTSAEWLQDRIRAAIPHVTGAEEFIAYLEASGIEVQVRRGPSGDLLGYAASRPGDVNEAGEQIYHPGSKISPDLSLPKIKARLESSRPEEHPTARRNHPNTPWHQATDALDTLHTDLADDIHAQAHITALGELLEATAQKTPTHMRADLRAASKAFARAQRSRVRAEDRSAHALRIAARDIVHTATGPDGSALAALVTALVWAVIVAGRWHEAKNHAHQADAARQAVQHLQTAADRALTSTLAELTARPPKEAARRVLASDVRAAVPDHAERILTDPAWPALATVLADAEARGHQPHQLLKEAAAQRELTTARQPARVLITRIQHTGRNSAPNRRAEAARLQTTTTGSTPTQQTGNGRLPAATPSPTEQQRRQRR
ncbi:relaxase/mobilization nuclease domain-containing protein [Streptomyces ossamyceticus]|uniref:Relaxase/mobilization nuclease domain-containing protein n=2 Tax=Streptomyces TaxID=1883 RepID=A0A927QQD3_9ACTN|nr:MULTISPECIES: relaxase/mobilization nuclease domain-containing protein [Streptomyces]MBD9729702.1 relaxase/mobilization nuclease domain-containing protein [Streptomyces caniscabiei]MBP5884498.1 relaxase/mobilization nuclease domain-containing protein [Streptomyces sp. LBUM 1487]MBP5892661.1 relaxase/mobilization nuclease domain-containing protein [Streptomyces sp. LBUM 1481]MBP5900521.1 relaxase/mobilization nuclease domain-containing protein [Streptomyces sp. LBUM 1488]MBP5922928.1 relaxas